ncbi:MAG: histidine kinase [Betaproteobacteria bacterium]|nr:histidine kinase [Betaproteobacteria bacterium]
MTKETPTALPDFRNLGILLRITVAAQILALGAALAEAPASAAALHVFLGYAAHLQPPLLASLLVLFLAAPRLSTLSYPVTVAACIGIAMLVSALWQSFFLRQYPDLADGGLLRAILLAGLVAGAILIWLDWRTRRLSPALAEARLQALQARIRPHFLFNTLNSVLSLVRSDPGRAEAALENLAELYRGLLADNRQLSSLERELELARAYLDLETLRLGERLHVDWRVDNAPADARLPALVLQPLLENAVCHGIEPSPEGGRVGVDIFARDGLLNVVVRNPCAAEVVARPTPSRRGNRMALSNIRERLALHFDAEARLSAHRVGEEFVVQMVMPLLPTGAKRGDGRAQP